MAGKSPRNREPGSQSSGSPAGGKSGDGTRPDRRASLAAISGFVAEDPGGDFHRLLNDRVRLGILSSLAVSERLSFTELRKLLAVSDGNLSVHARKLEEAGYIDCAKSFADRVPKTEYRISRAGRTALNRYLKHMEALIRATST